VRHRRSADETRPLSPLGLHWGEGALLTFWSPRPTRRGSKLSLAMPPPFRETLLLHDLQGLDSLEIAEVTGSLSACWSRGSPPRASACSRSTPKTRHDGLDTDPKLLLYAYLDGELDPAENRAARSRDG
jgi:hypothetical protein